MSINRTLKKIYIKSVMKTMKSNKELQANTHVWIDEDVHEKNARGKKSSWTKAVLKRAARHLRRLYKKVDVDE